MNTERGKKCWVHLKEYAYPKYDILFLPNLKHIYSAKSNAKYQESSPKLMVSNHFWLVNYDGFFKSSRLKTREQP